MCSSHQLLMSLLTLAACRSASTDFVDDCINPIKQHVTVSAIFRYGGSNSSVEFSKYGYAHLYNTPHGKVSGLVRIPEVNKYGCRNESYSADEVGDWIALVQRGNCTFNRKGEVALSLGAQGIIVYDNQKNSTPILMTGIPDGLPAVFLPRDVGDNLTQSIQTNKMAAFATLSEMVEDLVTHYKDPSNVVMPITACIMCPAAIILNIISLLAMYKYRGKEKPHLYLIGNLILTDLLVAIVSSISILLIYPQYDNFTKKTMFTQVYRPCINYTLAELWDMLMYSNLFTLLFLALEHYIAFKWPFKHKVLVTKKRVWIVIAISWMLSAAPAVYFLIKDFTFSSVESSCYEEKGFCWKRYYDMFINQTYAWEKSLYWVIVVSTVFVSMVLVYGYILIIVHKVKKRNRGFRKHYTALVTALCLVASFFVSYIFYYVIHVDAAIYKGYDTALQNGIHIQLKKFCPACTLILDYLLTGTLGAILDPIIYCVRTKEVKGVLNRFFKTKIFLRRPSVTSSTGYVKGAQISTTDVVADDHV